MDISRCTVGHWHVTWLTTFLLILKMLCTLICTYTYDEVIVIVAVFASFINATVGGLLVM